MPLYNFTLTLSGVTSDTEKLEDALYEGGCDDALIAFYGTSVYLEFDRESDSLTTAVMTAIQDIESAGLNARVESVDSVLVGLSDIAGLAGLTRQSVALLKEGARGPRNFPNPVQRLKGTSPLWRWKDVARWLISEGRLTASDALVESAEILENINLALQLRSAAAPKQIREFAHLLGYQEDITNSSF
ncbi:DNA-binding protein [Rahnella woolbedingensis]|uniref:DNA-binding protein n=1 Tax=Rahnella woolbedingensis TaxID=1510574 RepID=A0A419NCK2_9GAMM|nr:DNA-binding protein [Rahnella woolbedingensis]RJT46075.1 DNA-binding protein [Rahnella woolbedingensis]